MIQGHQKGSKMNGLNPKQYLLYSFGIGAAFGLPDFMMKSLGRWRGECYHSYVLRINRQKLCEGPKKLEGTQSVSI